MSDILVFDDQSFQREDYSDGSLPGKEYFNCSFIECDFTESDLSHIAFIECTFDGCNMKMTKFANSSLKDTYFRSCNLMGVNFFDCNRFMLSIGFDHCNLHLASFNTLVLKNIEIKESILKETDFSEADLTEAIFSKCDMERAVFMGTNLKKADLRNSENFSIDPENNVLTGARFSLTGVSGLLDKYNIIIE